MNPAALSAFFAQNKVAVLGAGAAGVVLLGLRARKKAAGGTATTAGVRLAQPAGTLPAAAVAAPGIGATYDSTGSDVYALQDEIGKFLQQQAAQTTGSNPQAAAAVVPVASTLFAPNLTGKYVRYTNGTVGEIESDGSVYGISGNELNKSQWDGLYAAGVSDLGVSPFDGRSVYSDRATNVLSTAKPAQKTS